jgi:hypothetical protein
MEILSSSGVNSDDFCAQIITYDVVDNQKHIFKILI